MLFIQSKLILWNVNWDNILTFLIRTQQSVVELIFSRFVFDLCPQISSWSVLLFLRCDVYRSCLHEWVAISWCNQCNSFPSSNFVVSILVPGCCQIIHRSVFALKTVHQPSGPEFSSPRIMTSCRIEISFRSKPFSFWAQILLGILNLS